MAHVKTIAKRPTICAIPGDSRCRELFFSISVFAISFNNTRMVEAGIHLKQARKKSGLAPEWVAQAVGVNLPSYYDMEDCDDLYMCTSLREIQKLCEILSITPEYLFTGETARPSGVQPDFSGLAQAIGRYCEEHHLSIPEFENRGGVGIGDIPARLLKSLGMER